MGEISEPAKFSFFTETPKVFRYTVLQVHTHLQVELDHRRREASSGACSPPSESAGAKGNVQPTVTAV